MSHAREQKVPAGQLNYRVATADDAVFLQRMVQDSFRHPDAWTGAEPSVMSQYTVSLERMMEKITRPKSTFIIVTEAAAAGGTPVACFQVTQKSATLTRFATFAVDVRHKGRGVARATVQFAEDYCRQTWGATTMQFNTLSNRAGLLAWYQRCGYRETGVRETFPWASFGGADRDEATLKDLYFAVMEKELEAAVASSGGT